MRDRFDDILKSKLECMTIEPSRSNWTSISNQLCLQNDKRILRRKIWSYGGIAALVALIVSIALYLPDTVMDSSSNDTLVPGLTHVQQTPEIESLTSLISSAKKISSTTESNILTNSQHDKYDVLISSDEQTYFDSNDNLQQDTPSETSAQNPDNKAKSQISTKDEDSYNHKSTESIIGHMPSTWYDKKQNARRIPKIRRASNWSVGLFASNAPIRSQSGASDITTVRSALSSSSVVSDLVEIKTFSNGLSEVITTQKLHHKMPISVGLSIRKNITPRWGIETGILYSYLESTGDMTTSMRYRRKQQLHYLGIPLSATYSFIKQNKWDAYVLFGGMAEHAIKAKINTKIYQNNSPIYNETVKLNLKGLLWSVNANLGIGFYPIRHLGFFVEPGLNYYFKNDSQPESYRTENPLSFNLRFGIRTVF